LPQVGFDRLPDADLALAFEQLRQRRVPSLAIGTVQLHVQHVLVALPGLIEQEGVLASGIAVQYRRMIHRLMLHRVEDLMQQCEERAALGGNDVELDDVRNWHRPPHAG
jgi:hypothetical protein